MTELPELPSKFQNAFETAKANAELEYATRAQRFPNNPQLANDDLHLPLLIHTVYFEFCTQARNARRDGEWTVAQARRAADAAWPAVCDFYFAREREVCSEEQKLQYRSAVWQTIANDPRWHQHLKDLATSNECESNTSRVVSGENSPDLEVPEQASELSDLPDLNPEAIERIERALKEAGAHLQGSSVGTAERNAAMLHYLDAIAWEFMCTRPAADFEALIDAIGEKARNTFGGNVEGASDRKRYWIAEARERAANGIVGEKVPVRINRNQSSIFHELQIQFRGLPGSGPDLQVMFVDGGWKDIRPGPNDPALYALLHRQFEQLARRAMAALGFKFVEPSRAVDYWLDLLRQESRHPRQWRISLLCLASAEFCVELETRALEASAREEAATVEKAPISAESKGAAQADEVRRFPNRARWLTERLRERAWNKHDLSRQGGPDHKTAQKVLDGLAIREDALEKVADALSNKGGKVTVLDIPQD